MIPYEYTTENRLLLPHSYTYSKYQGVEFFSAYEEDRISFIKKINFIRNRMSSNNSLESRSLLELSKRIRIPCLYLERLPGFDLEFELNKASAHITQSCYDVTKLYQFDDGKIVNTSALLKTLIEIELVNLSNENSKQWLDKIVQRFEVNKKIYEWYMPGFRKGFGGSDSVKLYLMVALYLSLSYINNQHIQCLSTLLKVIDLLSSLPSSLMNERWSTGLMSIVVLTELVAVNQLLNKRRA